MRQSATTHPPLIQVAVPQSGLLRDALIVLGFSLLVALSAQVSVRLPFTPVPVTGQTFGVLLTGALLGSRKGGLALLAYLAEGLAGLPVFAQGGSAFSPSSIAGVPVIAGPTAGFLFGFPLVAFVVGLLTERGWDRNLLTSIAAMVIGNLLLYVPGLLWLAKFTGPANALSLGFIPFIAGDLIKMALAAAALPSAWALVARRSRGR